MADSEHLAKLQDGVRTWNSWRRARIDLLPDLRGADLSGADFSGADLTRADLSGAVLIGTDLKRSNLKGAKLIGADLSWANLSGANLNGATLSRADLLGAELSKSDLGGAYLNEASLFGATLRKADLHRASLIRADLSGADLSGARLTAADLRDAELFYCSLAMADLTRATLSGARLDYAKWMGWKVHEVTCNHLVRGDEKEIVHFEPQGFESEYRQDRQLFEIILEIEFSDFAYFVGIFIANAVNEMLGSFVIQLKSLDAVSEEHTRLVFISFDSKFVQRSKRLVDTVLRGEINRILVGLEKPSLLLPGQMMMSFTSGFEGDEKKGTLEPWVRTADAAISEGIVSPYSVYVRKLQSAIRTVVFSVFREAEWPARNPGKH
jgi:uncharacterized protein YjbI with pentapeptide repeats